MKRRVLVVLAGLCRQRQRAFAAIAAASALAASPAAVFAQSDDQLARELANPIAALISIPLQSNWETRVGPVDGGYQYRLNIQPVVPFTLSEDWNLITRAILPVVWQQEIFPGAGTQTGLSDLLASFFFSPKAPTASGIIWGAGPVLLVPTATDQLLGTRRWGLGPTAVALRQDGPWTMGVLANHLWSVTTASTGRNVNGTFVQPFMSYAWGGGWSAVLQAEATYDWITDQSSVPIGAFIAKIVRLGPLPVQIAAGPRYYATHFDNGAKGWSARLTFIVLLPR